MQTSGIPATKFPIPFANGAGGTYIRPIPTPSQQAITPGAASLTDGFPPLNAQPVGAGGVPPFMQDFNGLLNQITAWTRWYNAGGPIGFDAAFSSAIGGYPKGAIIAAATFPYFWFNTIDGNTSNPDTGGAGWVQFTPTGPTIADSQIWHTGAAGGTANAVTTTLSPAPAHGATGFYIGLSIPSGFTNNASATLSWQDANGTTITAPLVLNTTGAAAAGGEFGASSEANIFYDGTSARVLNSALVPASYQPAPKNLVQFGSSTASGAFSWTCPAGVTQVFAQVWGGGGGGGGGNADGSGSTGGAGGNPGGYTQGVFTVVPGTTYAIVVGAGGSHGGGGGGSGTTGGASSFSSFCSATGGGGAGLNHSGTVGTGSGGTFNYSGQSRSSGGYSFGGNCVGSEGCGSWSSPTTGCSQVSGVPGAWPGGGGGGGGGFGGIQAGGAGANGAVFLSY